MKVLSFVLCFVKAERKIEFASISQEISQEIDASSISRSVFTRHRTSIEILSNFYLFSSLVLRNSI